MRGKTNSRTYTQQNQVWALFKYSYNKIKESSFLSTPGKTQILKNNKEQFATASQGSFVYTLGGQWRVVSYLKGMQWSWNMFALLFYVNSDHQKNRALKQQSFFFCKEAVIRKQFRFRSTVAIYQVRQSVGQESKQPCICSRSIIFLFSMTKSLTEQPKGWTIYFSSQLEMIQPIKIRQ